MSSCDTEEYVETRRTAFVMVALWPVGIIVLYGALLFMSREAIRSGRATALSHATTFLWADYKKHTFWWEPLEMCRKLTLSTLLLLELPSLLSHPSRRAFRPLWWQRDG